MGVAEAEEMVEEVVELENFAVLVEYEVGLEMHPMPTNDESSPTSEKFPTSKNQGEAVYNAD